MATSLSWPAILPCVLRAGYGVQPRTAAVEIDYGMVLRRAQVYQATLEEIAVSVILTHAQEIIFRAFYQDDLEFGSMYFMCPILSRGAEAEHEVMFTGPIQFSTPDAAGYITLSASLISRTDL